jgi:flagellar motor protein MotB
MRVEETARFLLVATVVAGVAGCSSNPFTRSTSTAPVSLAPPPGVAAPAHTLPQQTVSLTPSYAATTDPKQLEVGLARSRQEAELMQDEIAALREQLASTSSQLAQARSTGMPANAAAQATAAAPAATGMSPAEMEAMMTQLSVSGAEARIDGNVVRLEIPADRLFESDSANLLPGGAATLTQISTEVERVYPGHFLGIEGHTDTEPLRNASWGSPHQLSAARASAVFDFLTSRTALKQGQLFLVAHGPNHPVVSNATAAGRARNRRVEIVIYPEQAAPGDHPAAEPR